MSTVNQPQADIETKEDVQHVEATADTVHPLKNVHLGRADDAADLLDRATQIDVTEEDRKRVLRKIDLWVCVPMCITYTLQGMDKAGINYASVFDLIQGAHLVGSNFSWLSRWA
jgi:hypothetical protein